MTLRNTLIVFLLTGGLTAFPHGPVNANSNETKSSAGSRISMPDVSGADEFLRYCALCHGGDGRGAGPLTGEDAMRKGAADLTQIAKRNGGTFPFSKIADIIHGGGALAGHSPSRMLAWGKIFAAESDPVRAKAIIYEVTRYVEGLQEKAN